MIKDTKATASYAAPIMKLRLLSGCTAPTGSEMGSFHPHKAVNDNHRLLPVPIM